jgi:hypothetical protein
LENEKLKIATKLQLLEGGARVNPAPSKLLLIEERTSKNNPNFDLLEV